MKRRWLIRGFFIGTLALCAVAWVGSHWWEIRLSYLGDNQYATIVGGGRVHAYWEAHPTGPPGWHVSIGAPTNWESWDVYFARFDCLGFAYAKVTPSFGTRLHYYWVSIPFWFCTVLADLLLLLVWRMTRPKSIDRAFPIEPATKSP